MSVSRLRPSRVLPRGFAADASRVLLAGGASRVPRPVPVRGGPVAVAAAADEVPDLPRVRVLFRPCALRSPPVRARDLLGSARGLEGLRGGRGSVPPVLPVSSHLCLALPLSVPVTVPLLLVLPFRLSVPRRHTVSVPPSPSLSPSAPRSCPALPSVVRLQSLPVLRFEVRVPSLRPRVLRACRLVGHRLRPILAGL